MKSKVRGVVLLVLDTLRQDYESLCQEFGIVLKSLPRLRQLCPITPVARCGSFPTGPMRTDLLTGKLAFLRGEWAIPELGEETLISLCRKQGFWTALVTDNYVVTIPRLGGMLLDAFDTVDFIRGAGSDPWFPPSPEIVAAIRETARKRPTRNALFEAQFIANSRRWPEGVPPFQRVFDSACEHLRELVQHERFLLWVDTFACHEPWASASEVAAGMALPEEPLFPAYVEEHLYSRQHLLSLRQRFAQRVGQTDQALGPFVAELESKVQSGDVALVVLSDHGFLFGEFGFVGKPASTPLPPELYEILCWLSGHFSGGMPSGPGIQPHSLHWWIRDLLGIDGTTTASDIHLFARNSPGSNFLTAAIDDCIVVLEKARNGFPSQFHTVALSQMDRNRPLAQQGIPAVASPIREMIRATLSIGTSPWLDGFRAIL
jgi:hypothetical protein